MSPQSALAGASGGRRSPASGPAWRRLELWAEMFGPTSRAFLAAAPRHPDLALDLGCATGHTTRLLAGTLHPRRTVGLDRASSYIEGARICAPEGVGFLEHDVTTVPFPTGPAELVYSRFLLLHLHEPLAVLDSWATQIRPGGMLLLDEVEAVQGDVNDEGPVRRYLEMAAALQGRHGPQPAEVGPLLGAARWRGSFRCLSNRVVTLRPPSRVLVPIFLLNLRLWQRDPLVNAAYPAPALQRLASDLEELASMGASAPISWELRNVVLERA